MQCFGAPCNSLPFVKMSKNGYRLPWTHQLVTIAVAAMATNKPIKEDRNVETNYLRNVLDVFNWFGVLACNIGRSRASFRAS